MGIHRCIAHGYEDCTSAKIEEINNGEGHGFQSTSQCCLFIVCELSADGSCLIDSPGKCLQNIWPALV